MTAIPSIEDRVTAALHASRVPMTFDDLLEAAYPPEVSAWTFRCVLSVMVSTGAVRCVTGDTFALPGPSLRDRVRSASQEG